ncbi:MAG: SMC-Scp complex subunit ScpB [Euryarchaeota archaeon]|nr:SMC-Scp complex subunit ScpB [Euryarchaeota archaeon]
MDPKGIIEAALFSAGKPLSVGDISAATGLDEADVRKGMRKLLKAFRVRETAIEIVKSGSRYSMQVKDEYSQPTQKIARKEMGLATLKVAALVAYYQPMTKKDLVEMAGPKAWEHAEYLEKQGLVLIRHKGHGYSLETGQKFLEYFGLGAKSKDQIRRILAQRAGLKFEKKLDEPATATQAPESQDEQDMPQGQDLIEQEKK